MGKDFLIGCLAVGFFALCLIVGLARRVRSKKARGGQDLDKPLINWTPQDPFRVRDLLRSFCVQGASGSGKSSGVALQLARALLADSRIVFHIVASKPEDREWWQQRFAEAKRGQELRDCRARFGHALQHAGRRAEGWGG